MDLIMTGVSASERIRHENLVSACRDLIMDKTQIGGPAIRVTEVLQHYSRIFGSSSFLQILLTNVMHYCIAVV